MEAQLEAVVEKVRVRRLLPEPVTRRHLRERAGLTQADVADAIGVTRATIAHWEAGRFDPRGDNLGHYVTLLGHLAVGGSIDGASL